MKQLLKSFARRLMQPALASSAFDESVKRTVAPVIRDALVSPAFDESVKRTVAPVIRDALDHPPPLRDPLSSGARVNKGTQILLSLKYQELVRHQEPLPAFNDVGFRTFSQFDEDGLLLYIFSLIGIKTRKVVELCAGVGSECNAANWIINHGFHGLLFDGDRNNMLAMWDFYATWPDTLLKPPTQVWTWVTSDTIDSQIESNGFTGEVDLLSLDMDGTDYWILKAVQCIQPRVVVVEYHPGWLADEPMTIPDIKSFRYSPDLPAFCGASLAAFDKLLRGRGYRLVGCNCNRLNAFYVQNGLGDEVLPEVSVASCLDDHPRLVFDRAKYRPHLLKQKDWVRV